MGKVYIGSYNASGGPGALYCLEERSGEIIWESPTSSSVYFSSPSLHGDRVYIGTMGLYNSTTLQWAEPYGMYSFDANSGDLNWYYSVDGSVGSSPTIVDNEVLFTSKDGYLYNLDSENGELNWKKNIGSSVSSPAVWEDTIFVGSGEMNGPGKFHCLNMDGNILWEYTPNGAVQSSPAVSRYFVYFATNVQDGAVYCLNQTNGQLVWEFTPAPEQFIISSPAVVEDKLYVASDNGRLYCFGGNPPTVPADKSDKIPVLALAGLVMAVILIAIGIVVNMKRKI
jgi:outer membrane protein assembly factor BamB